MTAKQIINIWLIIALPSVGFSQFFTNHTLAALTYSDLVTLIFFLMTPVVLLAAAMTK